MLFHVTMTHTAEDCPGYNQEKMPELVAAWEKLDEMAKELKVKIHFAVNAAPEHVAYALLEAESLSSILAYVHANPSRQDFKVTPVWHEKDLIAWAKTMMERK